MTNATENWICEGCGAEYVNGCPRCAEQEECERIMTEDSDPRLTPMSDIGKFLFEQAQAMNAIYLAGMKAGQK